jgi:hypothetical protein
MPFTSNAICCASVSVFTEVEIQSATSDDTTPIGGGRRPQAAGSTVQATRQVTSPDLACKSEL